MSYAADAVLDVIAPPPRQPARATDDASAPEFNKHLDKAVAEDAPAAPSDPDNNVEDAAPAETVAAASAAPQAPTPQPTAAPVLLQLINIEGAPSEATAPAPIAAAAPTGAPADEAPALPLPGDANAEAEAPQPPTTAASAPPPARDGEVKNTATAKVDAQAPAATAPTAAPTSAPADATTSAPPQQQQTATPQATPSTAAPPAAVQAALTAAATPPLTANPPPQPATPPQSGKVDIARGEAKAEASDAKAMVQSTARKTQGAGAPPPQAVVSDGAAFKLADAPEAPPLQAQPLSLHAAPTASSTQHAVLEQTVTRTAPAAAQVAREIVRRFDGGNTRFELRLDPPELGRIEVRMEVSRDHRVTAVVTADSPQALNELTRSARELEQTLQAAGLELSDNGLSFDLRQSRDEADEARGGNGERDDSAGETALNEAPVAARPIGFERWRGIRVDVTV